MWRVVEIYGNKLTCDADANTSQEQHREPEEVSEASARTTTSSGGLFRFWNALKWKFGGESENEGSGQGRAIIAIEQQEGEGGSMRPLDVEQGVPEIQGESSSNNSRRNASSAPVCLICLETLGPDDFASGQAISLGCECRGDLALRHRECAIKWAQVKDDGRGGVPTCELCKKPVRNLPPLPPRPGREEPGDQGLEEVYISDPSQFQFAPSTADLVFDCIRVTWVAMIISILFFDASLGAALWTGLVSGMAYIVMLRVMYRQHFEAMRAYAEQHAAARQQFDPSGGQVPIQVV